MSELLLELFSEEIPARLQVRAAEDLRRLMVDGLKAKGLEVGEARAFATPRRLALVIADVPKKSPAISEEKKGPRVGAPNGMLMLNLMQTAGSSSDIVISLVPMIVEPQRLTFAVSTYDLGIHARIS